MVLAIIKPAEKNTADIRVTANKPTVQSNTGDSKDFKWPGSFQVHRT